ncbi:MAG: hypothetical protein H7Z41_09515 [Cytophagales bacterium]|nr:hypothetical protein [Armatimonadota bacterium]
MSHSMPALMGLGHLFLYEEALKDPANARLRPALRKRFAETAASRGIHLLQTEKPTEARRALRLSLRAKVTLRALTACALTFLGMHGSSATSTIRQGKSLLRIFHGRRSSVVPPMSSEAADI